MFFLSSAEANTGRTISIPASRDTEVNRNTARVSRERALNGKTIIVHSGAFETDRTVQLSGRVTRAQEAILWQMFNNDRTIVLCYDTSCFLAAMQELRTDGGELLIVLYLSEKDN